MFWQNILKLVSLVLMMIWMVKQLISTGFCIKIIKGQNQPLCLKGHFPQVSPLETNLDEFLYEFN